MNKVKLVRFEEYPEDYRFCNHVVHSFCDFKSRKLHYLVSPDGKFVWSEVGNNYYMGSIDPSTPCDKCATVDMKYISYGEKRYFEDRIKEWSYAYYTSCVQSGKIMLPKLEHYTEFCKKYDAEHVLLCKVGSVTLEWWEQHKSDDFYKDWKPCTVLW